MGIFSFPFSAMGSACELRFADASLKDASRAAQAAMAEVQRIEYKYSRYRPDSILSQINHAAGKHAIAIDRETADLLDYADVLFRSSAGLFDISSGILRRAWDFSQARLPAPELIAALLKNVGWQKVERTQECVYLPQTEMEIDFGGFGKEYAVDRAASLLLAQGVKSGFVDLGGDLRILGPQLDGEPWQIGIQDPRQAGKIIAHIPVSTGALATSGDYERFIDIAGVRYCHILNPHTGYPVHHWQSVTVLAPVALAAGSYATIAMLQQGDALNSLDESGLGYLLIAADGSMRHKDCAQVAN